MSAEASASSSSNSGSSLGGDTSSSSSTSVAVGVAVTCVVLLVVGVAVYHKKTTTEKHKVGSARRNPSNRQKKGEETDFDYPGSERKVESAQSDDDPNVKRKKGAKNVVTK